MPNKQTGSALHNYTMHSFPSVGISVDNMNENTTVTTQRFHYHDCYELYYIFSGACYFFVKDRSYFVQQGDLVLINAYDIHCATIIPEQKARRIVLYFQEDFLSSFFPSEELSHILNCFKSGSPVLSLPSRSQADTEGLFRAMLAEYQGKSDDYRVYLRTTLIQLLIQLNRHKKTTAETGEAYIDSSHKTISDITGYINNHYREDLSLSSVAEKFYISPYYLSRIFKKTTGFTFIDYLNGVRIKEAQRLLLTTRMKMTEIAESIGYKSHTHFGRVFKSTTGMSPLTYKKQGKFHDFETV